jgi:hypothetical protein
MTNCQSRSAWGSSVARAWLKADHRPRPVRGTLLRNLLFFIRTVASKIAGWSTADASPGREVQVYRTRRSVSAIPERARPPSPPPERTPVLRIGPPFSVRAFLFAPPATETVAVTREALSSAAISTPPSSEVASTDSNALVPIPEAFACVHHMNVSSAPPCLPASDQQRYWYPALCSISWPASIDFEVPHSGR